MASLCTPTGAGKLDFELALGNLSLAVIRSHAESQ